jgi:hypothetical protein
MSCELFEEGTASPHTDLVEDHEILELTLEQIAQVSGGGIVHRF